MKCKYCGKNISKSKGCWITIENEGFLEGLENYIFFCNKQCFNPWKTNFLRQKSRRKNAKYKFRQSYKVGVANRLYDRMQELGQACSWRNQTELKAQKKQISEFVKKEISIQTKEKKLTSLNTTAFVRGFGDGKDINLSRQMTGTETKRIGSH